MSILQAIKRHALADAKAVALAGQSVSLTYVQLDQAIDLLSSEFKGQSRPVAMAISNHPAWVVMDLVALQTQIPLVPLPFFFSDAQLLHAVLDAGADTLITDTPERFSQILGDFVIRKSTLTVASKRLMRFDLNVTAKNLPKGTAKITYTSGTTGQPKGVCLSQDAMFAVASSIATAATLKAQSQHLCVLPLSTLLENVAGVYASLLAGATVHLLPSETVGFVGSQFDIQLLHAAFVATKANSAILIPELLGALLSKLESGAAALEHLTFLAVGGAKVSLSLLTRAQLLGLPVYEGYGLSECASVVTLNTVNSSKIGSVGKALLHVTIKLSEDHEILVKGQHFLGYTNADSTKLDEWLATGDIGEIDADGFVYIKGRKKNIFITSFGRNVSPEWVESVLLNADCIAQVCVFGEAKPWNVALIVPKPTATQQEIQQAIDIANTHLPDYACIKQWLTAEPFTPANQQLTANGRLKREVIWQKYQTIILDLYKDKV
jgi:long-chain acyl-CoA synthetase